MDSSLESQRASLQTVLDAYVSQHYANSEAAASVLAKDGKLIVHISGEKPNLRNYWAGRWQSQWTLTPSGTNAALSGEIKVKFELPRYLRQGSRLKELTQPNVCLLLFPAPRTLLRGRQCATADHEGHPTKDCPIH